MAVRLIPADWAATTNYTAGQAVQHNGIRFVAAVNITGSSSNASPIGNETQWEFDGVLRITDYYSLQYSIQEAINNRDEEINNSIPGFIQQAERSLGKILRSPAQLERRIFTVDSESRFLIPGDLLAVEHMRVNQDNSGYDLRSRGSIAIKRAPGRTEWENLNQRYSFSGPWYGSSAAYEYPYWIADNQYYYLTPSFDTGTEIELEYYQEVPELGTTRLLVNDNYEAINSAGQTLAQWIAADSNNNAGNFVQGTTVVLNNVWTITQPHLIKAASCVEAFRFLKEPDMLQIWEAETARLLAAAEKEFSEFKASGSQGIQMRSAYCG